MAATVAAIAIAHLSLRVALSFMSQVLPRVDAATIDRRVVFFTIILGCLTAVAC